MAEQTKPVKRNLSRQERIDARIDLATRMIKEHYPFVIIAPFPTPEGRELLFSSAFIAGAMENIKRKIDRGVTIEQYTTISQSIKEAEQAVLIACNAIIESGYRADKRASIDKYVVERIKQILENNNSVQDQIKK